MERHADSAAIRGGSRRRGHEHRGCGGLHGERERRQGRRGANLLEGEILPRQGLMEEERLLTSGSWPHERRNDHQEKRTTKPEVHREASWSLKGLSTSARKRRSWSAVEWERGGNYQELGAGWV
ncbi:hypothetical protein GOP47_0006670 [Adiantum capillus-veneris]|uniref:Uncharacterized protein n=1 Tax=Adiantum capillus-veneris TaxID=13818 RepID=A0A9D4ZKM7_ADICA|nr:hypothetical protein GOP47_0006670 [Adiantum capillus-veneris]